MFSTTNPKILMKYFISAILILCIYACGTTKITSTDQVDLRNYDLCMQVKDSNYVGYAITEKDILDFGISKEVTLDSSNNIQTVKYIEEANGHIQSEYVFYRKSIIPNNMKLQLGQFTDMNYNLERYLDSIYVFFYDSSNVRESYRAIRPYSRTWKETKKFHHSELTKVGEYAKIIDYSKKREQDTTNIKGFCDFSKVFNKILKKSQDRDKDESYMCRIFINPAGKFYQMYCSNKIEIKDINLIMDVLSSFDYTNFLACIQKENEGFEEDIFFRLGIKNTTSRFHFVVH